MMLTQELEAFRRDEDWYLGAEPPEMVHIGP